MPKPAKYTKEIEDAFLQALSMMERKISELEKRIQLLEKEKNE